jgi:hypothetical protein
LGGRRVLPGPLLDEGISNEAMYIGRLKVIARVRLRRFTDIFCLRLRLGVFSVGRFILFSIIFFIQ